MKFTNVLLVFSIITGCLITAADAGWQIERVDCIDHTGYWPSLVLDPMNTPHISFYDPEGDNLCYLTKTGIWVAETVDSTGDVGRYSSIALNKPWGVVDIPCISYYDNTLHDLKYARFDPTGGFPDWIIETVDSTGDVGEYSSLAFDSGWSRFISYNDATGDTLNLAEGSNIEPVDSVGASKGSSLAIDELGNPCIAYNRNGDLYYAKKTGHDWLKTPVYATSNLDGRSISLALDELGNPHISYVVAGSDVVDYKLMYSQDDGSGWKHSFVESIYDFYGDTSLAIDASGKPCIAYDSTDTLKYAKKVGSEWDIQTVAKTREAFSEYCSLALDSEHNPHIIFTDQDTDSMYYASYIQDEGIGVFRPSAFQNWILDFDIDGDIDLRDHYGISTDIPLMGDFNNDGNADRAVFRGGEWIIDYDIDGSVNRRPYYGMAGDIPLVGHMNKDGITDYAVFRNGQWIIDRGMDGTVDVRDNYGVPGDIPLIGDFNDDGVPDRAVFRPSAWDNWIFDYRMDGSVDTRNHYGDAADIPIIVDINVDGITDRAVFRNGEWIIDYNMDGSVNLRPRFGMNGDLPLVWN